MKRGSRHRRGRAVQRRATYIVIGVLTGVLVLTAVVVAVERHGAHRDARVLQAESLTPSSATPSAPPAPAQTPATTTTLSTAATPPSTPPVTPSGSVMTTTTPERMTRLLPGSRQLIVITGTRIGSRSGMLAVYNESDGHWVKLLSAPANFGAKGLVDGATRSSGHLQTPTGIWTIGRFLFGQHASPPAGTMMPYRHILRDSWWSEEHNATYNTWVSSMSAVSGEHLADAVVQYEYAFNSGYNSPPNQRVIGRGTAIFIHCAEPPGNSLGEYTHGCIAVDRSVMKRLFTVLDPGRDPSCAIGTLEKGSPTSIWAY